MVHPTLFVIIDPTREEQPALARAAALLRNSGGHIHGFCCVYTDDFGEYASRRDGKRAIRQETFEKLNALLRPLASDSVSVAAEVYWNEIWFESAVQACTRIGADLMLKSSSPDHHGSHRVSGRPDRYILRHSPCPVLLTKSVSDRPYSRVLAALALEDNDRKHDVLNNHVMAQAQRISRTSGAGLDVVAALEGTPNVAQLLQISRDEDQEIVSDEELVSERFGVAAERVHMDYGPARFVITETAERINADLLVIGTVARGGVSGAVIGNTSEKVLAAVAMDVLIVG